jgi:hypothetical protein
MAKLRVIWGFGVLLLSAVGAAAEPDSALVPIRPPVPDRRLQLPFDIKTDPTIKVRGPDAWNAPAALEPTTRERRPFFGLGVSRPIGGQ